MLFTPSRLNGAWLVELDRREDERGFFARSWCTKEFAERGLNPDLAQCSVSFNLRQGTVRGMHFQKAPHAECKLVRCTQGAIFDVIVDVREESPTFGQWQGFELSAKNRRALYIPEGFAHGFQSLTDNAEVFYQISQEYHAPSAGGVRWNDPAINVVWPQPIAVISERDQQWPDLKAEDTKTIDQFLHSNHPNQIVLVTGATGLIGRNCLPLLTARGYEVHAVTHQTSPVDSSVKWRQIDLLAPGRVESLIDRVRPTHLLHLAWYTAPGTFWSSAENREWMDASIRLFRAFEQSGGKRIVATGTCAEYDWSAGLCCERSTPCRPGTLYGQTKLATATYLDTLQQRGRLTTAWARLFFLYGPGASAHRMPGVVIESIRRGQAVDCSAGTQQRDFLLVQDAADAIVTLLGDEQTGPFNICSGRAIAIRDLAMQAATLMGRPELLRLGAKADSMTEQPLVVGDTGRLTNELNWKPQFTLEQGLQLTIDDALRGSILPIGGQALRNSEASDTGVAQQRRRMTG